MAGGLTARKVETAKPGKYSDGGNFYLIVSPARTRKWVLRFTWRGRAREMGLGSADSVTLADARDKAATARRMLAQGLDPIDERKRTGNVLTFGKWPTKCISPSRRVFATTSTRRNGNRRWKPMLRPCGRSLSIPSPPTTCSRY